MNYDVPSCWNLRPIAPQDFTDAAPYAIPHYSAAQGFLDADSESTGAAWSRRLAFGSSIVRPACFHRILRAKKSCKLRARATLARAIYGFVFDAF
jgi:hypothetical protein